jgi:hypothetical protein
LLWTAGEKLLEGGFLWLKKSSLKILRALSEMEMFANGK